VTRVLRAAHRPIFINREFTRTATDGPQQRERGRDREREINDR